MLAPMHIAELTPPEQRVLGCLIEKRWTTPDQYPLSLNGLRLACNQSTNRDPVTTYDEATVRDAAQRLCLYGLARLASGHGSRSVKYRHLAEEALGLDREELAVLAVLLLRGPQTPGELKARTERLAPLASLDDVERVLTDLAERDYARRIGRRPGQKEDRFEHLLGSRVEGPAPAPSPIAPAPSQAAPAPWQADAAAITGRAAAVTVRAHAGAVGTARGLGRVSVRTMALRTASPRSRPRSLRSAPTSTSCATCSPSRLRTNSPRRPVAGLAGPDLDAVRAPRTDVSSNAGGTQLQVKPTYDYRSGDHLEPVPQVLGQSADKGRDLDEPGAGVCVRSITLAFGDER